ncbi:hypothetical protein JCM18899A_05090 [Nocardioides sp. AN3]
MPCTSRSQVAITSASVDAAASTESGSTPTAASIASVLWPRPPTSISVRASPALTTMMVAEKGADLVKAAQ